MSLYKEIATAEEIYKKAIIKHRTDRAAIINECKVSIANAGLRRKFGLNKIRKRVDELRVRYEKQGSFKKNYKGGTATKITEEALQIGIKYYTTDVKPDVSQEHLDIGLSELINIKYKSSTWYYYQQKLLPHITELEDINESTSVIQISSSQQDVEDDFIDDNDDIDASCCYICDCKHAPWILPGFKCKLCLRTAHVFCDPAIKYSLPENVFDLVDEKDIHNFRKTCVATILKDFISDGFPIFT